MLHLSLGLLAGAILMLFLVFLLVTNLSGRVCCELCLLRCTSGKNADQTCHRDLVQ